MPQTKTGKWSLALIILMPTLILLGSSFADTLYAGISSRDSILQDVYQRPVLALTILTGMGSGIGAFFTGGWAIWKKQEHSKLVYMATVFGAVLIIFLVNETIFSH